MIKPFLFGLLLVMFLSSSATSLVEGIIYFKDGRVLEFQEKDRIRIPRKNKDVKTFYEAFAKSKRKELFPQESIDSVVCWNARTPEHTRKFIPAPSVGWCWVYFETPYILVCVYAGKGYGIAANGGIEIYQRRGIFRRSKVAYYLRKSGDTSYYSPGKMKNSCGKTFRERLCRFVSDDTELCKRIRNSDTRRYKTITMLKEYHPESNP